MEFDPGRPDTTSQTIGAGGAYRFTGTLLDRLGEAANDGRDGAGITFIEGASAESCLSYRDLRAQAELRARQLLAFRNSGDGIPAGSEVILPVEDNREFVTLFWACLMAGLVPIPLAGGAHDELNLKLVRIWRVLDRPRLLTTEARARKLLDYLKQGVGEIGSTVIPIEALSAVAPYAGPLARPQPNDLAFLQFSSGSTGEPKGVRLTHANLLANIGSTLRGSLATSADSMLSWMPLSHDMGLIGVHLRSVSAILDQFLMPTSLFIRRPLLWLDLVHKHGATHLVCPNFGYEYLLSALGDRVQDWDLSRVRVISNGAEPISEKVATRFCEAMARYRLSPNVIQACYGLAENTLAVSLSVPGEPLRTWSLRRDRLSPGDRIELGQAGEDSLALVDCGRIVDTVEVKIAAEDDEELPELQVGRILISGESTTGGYYNNSRATGQIIRQGWLDTGDLGFRSGNRLVISGRAKELIILNGSNFYPYDIERVVEDALALEGGSVVACGCRTPGATSEQLVLFIRHKGSAQSFTSMAEKARREVAGRMGALTSDVVQVRKIPKTTSGKVQRYRLAESWESGTRVAMPQEVAVRDTLKAITELALGLTNRVEIDPDRNLSDQGIDSLLAVELSQRIGTRFSTQLPVSLAFDYPNLRAIAAYLEPRRTVRTDAPKPNSIDAAKEPIAILGAGVRLPGGVHSLEEFWQRLKQGFDTISEVPVDRWNIETVYDPDRAQAGKMSTRYGAFLDNVDQFDAPFFEISGIEARDLDPQQRLLLETTWEALEHAGQNASELRGTQTGVFVGISNQDYARRHVHSGDLDRIGPYALTGSSPSAAAGRISYCFGFEGPSMAIDTACSSSLVAVHLAAKSLQAGESAIALAAGVNLILGPEVHVGFSKMHAMAADGRCKTFDAAADGYSRGEACLVIVLKRLSDALAAGDPILAVLCGSAVNQDGASNGFTAPNGLSQRAVIRRALADAGMTPSTIGFVECHGTGTPVGDPQELAALAEVYGSDRSTSTPLLVGSVKTNVGHTEAAAGLAGLLKAILCVRYAAIPPSLHFLNPSPLIPWAQIPVRIPVSLEEWPDTGQPRRAAVSSFGFTGTNAHAILEAPPTRASSPQLKLTALLLVISAKSPEALAELRCRWLDALSDENRDIAALCRTAALHRSTHRWRLSACGSDRVTLVESLKTAEMPATAAAGDLKVAFVFPGQGSQWAGMGRDMMLQSAAFHAAVHECSEGFRPYLEVDMAAALSSGEEGLLSRIDFVQPALFAIQVALAAAWRACGIDPAAVIGHSMGEVAAAHIAGVLSLSDAARIICKRSSLLRRIAGHGAMASVDLTLEQARKEIVASDSRVSIAASNGPGTTVLAGDPSCIDDVLDRLETRGVYGKRIQVDVASHSPQVDILQADIEAELAGMSPAPARIPMCSTVSANWVAGEDLGARYWMDNLRQPVMFSQGFTTLMAHGIDAFIEVSAHPVLVPFMEDMGARKVTVGSLRRNAGTMVELYSSLGRLWQAGAKIDWRRIFPDHGTAVAAPCYPWQRQKYWLEATPSASLAIYPGLGAEIEVAGENLIVQECEIRLDACSWLEDHKVGGAVVFPAAAYLELMARTARSLTDIRFLEALSLTLDTPVQLQLLRRGTAIEIRTREKAEGRPWVLRCTARIDANTVSEARQPEAFKSNEAQTVDSFYRVLEESGLRYGPAFRLVEMVRASDRMSEGVVRRGPQARVQTFSPAFLDACLQTLAGTRVSATELWLPSAIGFFSVLGAAGEKCLAQAEFRDGAGDVFVSDSATNTAVFSVQHVQFRRIGSSARSGPAIYSMSWTGLKAPPVEIERRVALAGTGRWFCCDAISLSDGATDIVYVAPLRPVAAAEDVDLDDVIREVQHLMEFVQYAAGFDGIPPRLRLVTKGNDPTQAALRGFFRSVVREYPEMRPVAIDLSESSGLRDFEIVLADWSDADSEIAVRGGEAYIPRITPAVEGRAGSSQLTAGAFIAQMDRPGDLDNIAYTHLERKPPKRGEIEIEVDASGLNFLNVLSALGAYPGYPEGFRSLGIECAGRVTKCGEGVTEFYAGDAVFGIAEHTLASHVSAPAALFARNPGFDIATAAGMPVAYLTAAWSLRHLARLEEGETVLIHSATGGVGRAAIEVARRAGAKIIATAGSESRRAALRASGIEYAFDSRSSDFEHGVRDVTGGRGVDVVLNSLSGEGMEASLRCLAPLGRFVEIGKRELYGHGKVSLENFRAAISYFVVDLDRLATERETQVGRLWRELAEQLRRGELATLPVEEYGFSEAPLAFSTMAQAKHRTKIVMVRKPDEALDVRQRLAAPRIEADATYIVTGGTGAIGMLAASWILEHGGRNLVLISRGGGLAEAREMIERWNREGAHVRFMQADVADAGSLNRVLAIIESTMPPLGGIVHAAGCLADSTIGNMEGGSIAQLFSAKVGGALNLHTLTVDMPLEFFVMVSSAAGVFGPAGQANYAAANAALGSIAELRQLHALKGVAVALGPVAGKGLASQASSVKGVPFLKPEAVAPLLFEAAGSGLSSPLAMELLPDMETLATSTDTRAEIVGMPSRVERLRALEDLLSALTARLLHCAPTMIERDSSFKSLGLDSLMAMQLRNRLNDALGIKLQATTFWKYPSLRLHAEFVEGLICPSLTSDAAETTRLEQLSDAEAERLLIEKVG